VNKAYINTIYPSDIYGDQSSQYFLIN